MKKTKLLLLLLVICLGLIVTLAACKKTYTVKFMVDGETYETVSLQKGEVVALPDNPSKTDYIFNGWFYGEELNNQYMGGEISESLTVYATWTFEFIVGFNSNGGTFVTNITFSEGGTFTFPAEPKKDGYIFRGWYFDDVTFVDPLNNSFFNNLERGGVAIVYAKWEAGDYTITYDLDGGVNHSGNPDMYTIEESVTLKNPTRTGYDFAGWTEGEANIPTILLTIPKGTFGDLTFTAHWTPIVYNINYELNEGDNHEDNPATYTIEDAVTINEPTRDGYNFIGWTYEGQDTPVMEYAIAVGTIGDITLTANWALKTYELNVIATEGGSVNTTGGIYYAGDAVTLIATRDTFYQFDGWFVNGELLDKASDYTFIMTKGDCEVEARFSEIIETEGLKYTLINNNTAYEVSVGTATGLTEIVIPAVKDGLPVTRIANNGFRDNFNTNSYARTNKIAALKLPEGIIEIGANAFDTCSALPGVTLPSTLIKIGDSAFYNCAALLGMAVPNSVESLGVSVFAYSQPTGSKFSWVTLSTNLIALPERAFQNCISLVTFTLPSNILTIGSYAFTGCANLSSLTLHDNISSIGQNSFSGCIGLKSFTIPAGLTAISNNLFYNTGLTSITIPSTIATIGNNAFQNSASLGSIVIPATVTSIGTNAFTGCTGLKTVKFEGSTPISANAFNGCTMLNTIDFGSVTSIGELAFTLCTSLVTLVIPEGITSIGKQAFSGCTSLASAKLPNSLTSCGAEIFRGCYLTSIETYKNFAPSGDGMYVIDADCNIALSGVGFIIVKDGVHTLISVLTSVESITLLDPITVIGDYALSGTNTYANLKYAVLPKNLTTIGSYAFNYAKITSIILPDALISIGTYAFNYCQLLTSIAIPYGLSAIPSSAFNYCTSLASVTIPNTIVTIGSSAFYYCSALTSITIPSSVTTISSSVFSGLNNLTIYVDTLTARPDTWVSSWNNSRPVVWGCTVGYDNSITVKTVVYGQPYVTSFNKTANITGVLSAPARFGYVFKGWFDNALFTGTAITATDIGTAADGIYFAKWE